MAVVVVLLAASGIASAVSGASAIALAVTASEPQSVTVVASGAAAGWALALSHSPVIRIRGAAVMLVVTLPIVEELAVRHPVDYRLAWVHPGRI